ncbi:hypothetical protein OS493_010212 [Desmophyllum pertusum]|uniref:Uncharacterized protein n=1 Tax=Desmophyllum pertusum TaxID=174260 RepID=A0A9X0DAA9_9CNID|nr:hypothetical protein OS493_010212 [Desmophyllum pertusum]
MQSKMPEVRDQEDSAQRNEAQRWIKNVVVVILVALLLFVLFKERHDSRKLLEELSNRLAKTEKESENLRKELDVTKAKVDKMLERFPNVQKASRFRRSHIHSNKTKCHGWKHCMSKYNKDLIHVKIINLFSEKDFGAINKNLAGKGFPGAQLSWQEYFRDDGRNIAFNRNNITILTGGTYFVYCRLRVGRHISKVFIKTGNSAVLFSSSPTFANDTNGDYYGVVRMFGLAKILTNTILYVQVKFKDRREVRNMSLLFPGYSEEENSFGAFLVS